MEIDTTTNSLRLGEFLIALCRCRDQSMKHASGEVKNVAESTSGLAWVFMAATLLAALWTADAQAAGVVSVCDDPHLKTALAGGGLVTFSCSGTIQISGTITISSNTTIDGTGQAVTLQGGTQRIIVVDPNKVLAITNVILAYGHEAAANGGAILNRGSTSVNSSTFFGNLGATEGGAIYNHGVLTVTNSTFSNNISTGGGAIYNQGVLTVTNSAFSANAATRGGAIFNDLFGQLTIMGSTFSGNTATQWSGAILSAGSAATVSNSTFTGNSASEGGAIGNFVGTPLTVTGSTFSGNTANGSAAPLNPGGLGLTGGGAIRNFGYLTLTGSTISGNSSSGMGGGVLSQTLVLRSRTKATNSAFDTNCAEAGGGAIASVGGDLTITDSGFYYNESADCNNDNMRPSGTVLTGGGGVLTYFDSMGLSGVIFEGNKADYGGAIHGALSNVDITHSRFSSNSAIEGGALRIASSPTTITSSTLSGNSATALGGALRIAGGTATLTNSTLSGNTATVLGGAIDVEAAGTLTLVNATVSANSGPAVANGGSATLRNSIVAGNTGASCSGTITDGGYNLSSDASCAFTANQSTNNVSAAALQLGALASNGGPTKTHALAAGSVAIDKIPSGTNGCGTMVTTDQRGGARPQNASCDIGAFEFGVQVVGDGTAPSCTATALSLAVSTGGVVTFSCPPQTTITLTLAIVVSTNTSIDGIGQSITISGGGIAGLFIVGSGVTFSVNNITLASGDGGFSGGAIGNSGGTVTVDNTTFKSNMAFVGGALANGGTMTVTNSTFYMNSSTNGGAIVNSGTLTITNSTFLNNTATTGGAISRTGGTVTLRSSLLVGTALQCGGSITDGGYNRSQDNSCGFLAGGSANGATNLNLGTLALNGGPTETIGLLAGSTAINAIPPATNGCGTTVTKDQRGVLRPQNGNCDIGAFEVGRQRRGQLTSQ